jgi:hypothetical protein
MWAWVPSGRFKATVFLETHAHTLFSCKSPFQNNICGLNNEKGFSRSDKEITFMKSYCQSIFSISKFGYQL